MEQKKQKELNRIAAMAAKRRDDVRKLVAEDVRQYTAQQKRSRSADTSHRQLQRKPKTEGGEETSTTIGPRADSLQLIASANKSTNDQFDEHSKKRFSLNLPSVTQERRSSELHALQSALSVASMASSVLPSTTRSSVRDIDIFNDTSRSFPMSIRRASDDPIDTKRKIRTQKPLSVLEQRMMERTMQSLKDNIVKKQIVMNKEYEGKSFITKPNELIFNDFEVGNSYAKKLTVTNVSLSFNTFKVLDLPARVSDFFKVVYAPPGRLSAGTGVTIEVTFTPALPTPISEKLVILAETGQFEIPIECLPKQCKVSLSTNHVEFDNISLGETQVKTIKVLNNGGLESTLNISFDYESCTLDGSSDTCVDPEGNVLSVATTVQSSVLLGTSNCILGAYSSLSFDITFRPKVLGFHSVYIVFQHKGVNNNPTETRFLVTGIVSDVPIYLSSREIDFRACYCGQLYREVIVLHNRGKIALKATVKVPTILKKYVEIVPRVAFVQAHSSLSVQLKLMPTVDLLTPAAAHLMSESNQTLDIVDSEGSTSATQTNAAEAVQVGPPAQDSSSVEDLSSCTISMPVTVDVASQPNPIWFQLKALVTNPVLAVQPSSLDFGECSINESVSIPFSVYNHSVASVRYGFVHLPKEVHIIPGDGFGTLLPQEELKMVAIFSPTTATQHNFSLNVKTDQGRSVTILCTGTGVKPALQFSPAIIALPPTSLGDVNTTSVFLENISKVPHTFEICVPDDFPFLQVTPVVNTINPGSRVHIKIDFEPSAKAFEHIVASDAAKEEYTEVQVAKVDQQLAVSKPLRSRSTKKASTRTIPTSASSASVNETSTYDASQNTKQDKKPRKKKGRNSANSSEIEAIAEIAKDVQNEPQQQPQLQQEITSTYCPLQEGKMHTWKLPCYSKPSKQATLKDTHQANTDTIGIVVYVEISAMVAPPTLVRVLELSERGTNINPPIDFGQVPIGQSIVKKLTIKNNYALEIKPQLAAVYGTITILNAIRSMPPGHTQILQIQYKPDAHGIHRESLELLVGKHHRLVVPVQGQGVEPKLHVEPLDDIIDLGHTIAKDTSKKEIKLINASQFSVSYQISLLRIGPKNVNGANPFSVIPAEGDIPVGKEKVITILFEPDHENCTFEDELQIAVKSENSLKTIHLKGSCTGTRGMYLLHTKPKEIIGLHDVVKPGYFGCVPHGSITLNLFCSDAHPFPQTLTFGNAKLKHEKGIVGEVALEPLSAQAIKDGFSVDTSKFSLEPDGTKSMSFKFSPPLTKEGNVKQVSNLNEEFNFNDKVETTVKCTLKGGYSAQDKEGITFTIILIGHVKM